MALVLGVKVGEVIDIADHWLTILSIDGRNAATLIVETGLKTTIHSSRMTEVISNIWIGLEPEAGRHRLRLLIEAPRQFSITRRADPTL
ncbi:hypothetical protein KQ910_07935 [Reyranella sp. MMS21-HV4-11]|uniref:Carbon storage regulator n=1 Tax=Reyranella humidisoli TaxID=2849149 RepID=A0ABS6IKD3_9HYPH|nr:hypothetical protein [Reyranella sp. MMS21-HV4-11]MBU8873690.1 hypothetical protein [Reyranella sp. MMS21-HV4-11]